VAAALAATALAVAGQLIDPEATPPARLTLSAAIAVAATAMAALILTGVPGHPVGRLMGAAGGFAAVNVVAGCWAGWAPMAWLSQWTWWPPIGLIVLALLVFPDGRLPSPRWRGFGALLVAATVVAALALAVAALDDPHGLIAPGGPPPSERTRLLLRVAQLAAATTVAGLLGVLAGYVVRWRRADPGTRAQLSCLLPAGALLLVALVLEALGLTGAWLVAAVVVPLAITIAVLRYHLYDLDQVINRSVVWLVMSLLVIAGFVAIVALVRDLLMGGDTSRASLVATGLIAVTFEPLRQRVQHGVDHLLYGERDDPYKVIARLGGLLGQTIDATAVLPLLTGTIATSLRVPYVAVELDGPDGPRIHAEHGRPTVSVESFPMVAHGERIGRLLVAPRTPTGHFTRRESRLLGDVALHAAVAAEATQLTRDLQDSRERLVMAREEERRRLRRDLHDGVGPSLAGMSMQVRAARKVIERPTRVGDILDTLASDLQGCTAEVRQLVDQLRPAALDGGLEAALRTECRRFDGAALAVDLSVTAGLDGLPAAIEVAVYRIVAEALTNVARHARAGRCRVTVGRDTAVTVEVVDDGVGLAGRARRGVGLTSMRERAAELGGDCVVTDAPPHGTAVRVRLPMTLSAMRPAVA